MFNSGNDGDPISILDFSEDGGIFSSLLAQRFQQRKISVSKVVVTVRGRIQIAADPAEVDFVPFDLMHCSKSKEFDEKFNSLGRFDLIVLKEMLYEAFDFFEAFFKALRLHCIKNDDSHLIIMTLAKESMPVPMPNNALMQWQGLAISKAKLYKALLQVITD